MAHHRNGILFALALTFTATACGYQAADDGDGTEEGTPSTKPPQKDGTGGGTGTTDSGPGGGGTGGSAGGTDAGAGGTDTDAGSGGSPPVSADAGTGGSAGGTDAGAGGGTSQPDPVVVTGSCAMKFSTAYVGGSTTAEIRGNLPGATWSSGPAITDTNADKYLEYASPSVIGAGFYELTYMVPPSTWANLGDATALKAMTPSARAFVNCNWWDPATLKTVSVPSPSCNLRIMVGGGCTISAAGNMKDFK